LRVFPFGEQYRLYILSAGQDDGDYLKRFQTLDWELLFEQHQLGQYLEELRHQWCADFDYVLVDSRTGITDIGGICTIYLPDVLVLFFTTNRQSLDGVTDVASRANLARSRLPFDRAKLVAVPVPARDESRTEYEQALRWRRIFARTLAPLYQEWLPFNKTPEDILELLRIPYIPYWSFGERLPVVEEGVSDPTSLGFAYASLARLIFNRLTWGEGPESTTTTIVSVTRLGGDHVRGDKAVSDPAADQDIVHGEGVKVNVRRGIQIGSIQIPPGWVYSFVGLLGIFAVALIALAFDVASIRNLLSTPTPTGTATVAPNPTPTMVSAAVVIAPTGVTLRADPAFESSLVFTLTEGATRSVLNTVTTSRGLEWWQVEDQSGRRGWVVRASLAAIEP
jgi:hypothetical protein